MSSLMSRMCAALSLAVTFGCPGPEEPVIAAGRHLIPEPGITAVRTVAQNWSDLEAMKFYNMPQGSKLAPYTVFLHLEQDTSRTLFRDAGHIRSLGFLPVTPQKDFNPDGLPLGFVEDGDHVGLTCAACHTAQINYQGTAWLIDGGPTLGDAAGLLKGLVGALRAARADVDGKFERLTAATGLGESVLRAQLDEVIERLSGYTKRNLPVEGQPAFGPGRIDAFGAILNEVAVRFAGVPGNETRSNAPVSYPFLWDTPQHDFVQWPGTTKNSKSQLLKLWVNTEHYGALGRNIGEVMGVFGNVGTEEPRGLLGLYASSINKPNLIALEESVARLWSPEWPAEFGPIDPALRTEGEELFHQAKCSSCHESIQRNSPTRAVTAKVVDVGTDQTMLRNAVERRSKSGRLQGRRHLETDTGGRLLGVRTLEATEPTLILSGHIGQLVLLSRDNPSDFSATDSQLVDYMAYRISAELPTTEGVLTRTFSILRLRNDSLVAVGDPVLSVRKGTDPSQPATRTQLRAVRPLGAAVRRSTVEQFARGGEVVMSTSGSLESAGVRFPYKARPLNGIWATAPYLHNGSVPNLHELLLPPAKRSTTFYTGSREFDPLKVGYVSTVGPHLFSTEAVQVGGKMYTGNSNAGHNFSGINGTPFTEAQIRALLEYLKSQ